MYRLLLLLPRPDTPHNNQTQECMQCGHNECHMAFVGRKECAVITRHNEREESSEWYQ